MPSASPSNLPGSDDNTLKFSESISPQSESGGAEDIHWSG